MGSENNQNQSVNNGNPNYEEFLSYPEFSPLTDESSSDKKRIAAYVSEESQKAEANASATKKKDNKIESFFRKILLPTTVAVATVVTAETIGIVNFSGVSVVGEPIVESYETSVWYSMELEGYQIGGDGLAVEVYNDFEHHRELVQTEQDQTPREDGQNPEKGGWIAGEVRDLKPDTDYTFEVLYGSWTVYKQKIRTAKQEEPWQDDPHDDPDTGDPVKPAFSATETEISFLIPISDVSEGDWYLVHLLENGDTIDGEDFFDISLDQESIRGVFTDLQPGTEYTVQLMKNQAFVSEWAVSTLKPEEESLEPWFEAGETSIYYGIPITWEQTADDWYTAMLMDVTGLTREGQAEIDEDGLYVTGVFPDLQPGTTYTFRLMKNREVVYTETISTQEDPTADPVFPSG